MLGPTANNSFNFINLGFELILISSLSKDKPSPDAKSASPPKSANDNNLITPGAFFILKFSIISLNLKYRFQ